MSDRSPKTSVADSSYVHSSAVLEGEVTIGEECFVGAGAILSGKVAIGDGCYVGERSVLTGDVLVGDHTLIQINVVIRGHHRIGSYVHIYDFVNMEGGRPYDETGDRSIIGDYAWINHGATMHGSQIGEQGVVGINAALDYHCTVGNGAIVTNGSSCYIDTVVPDNCIAEGVPAKVVKRNITDDDRRELLGLLPREWAAREAESIVARVRSLKR
jgi:carbonic anhydrase/acetyltransferase-like protein (isoleucine patch superfamily)